MEAPAGPLSDCADFPALGPRDDGRRDLDRFGLERTGFLLPGTHRLSREGLHDVQIQEHESVCGDDSA